MPKSLEDDLEYQEVVARRMEAAKQDIPEFDGFEWLIYNKSYPGIPLKHFLDNLGRFGSVEHDAECPVPDHSSFFNVYQKLLDNEIHSYEPQVCPQYPRAWT